MGEFGDKFRKAREKKNISLDDVSKVTKIGTRMLQAIEEENFDVLPGGVFNKGFIRAFAKSVGLDEQDTINEYLECQRRAQADAFAASDARVRALAPEEAQQKFGASRTALANQQRAAGELGRNSKTPRRQNPVSPASTAQELPELQLPRQEHLRPPRRLYDERGGSPIPLRLVAALILVVSLGLLLWQRHSRGAHAQSAGAPAAQSAPTPAQSVGTAPPVIAPAAVRTETPASLKERVSTGAITPTAGNPALAPARPAVSNVAAGTGSSAHTAAAAAESASRPLELVIRANENSWISVAADGQVVSQETLIAPANAAVSARREIVAKIGNAAGVTFVWNGREIPAQGGEAEVKTFVFDPSGMRVLAPANQSPAQEP